jgi:phosphoglycerate dehydrogenase-like enzyme
VVTRSQISGHLIAVAPLSSPHWVIDAVRDAGAQVVEPREAHALVWTDPRDADGLNQVLVRHPHLVWVQVPFAGVENFIHLIDDSRVWTCGKGVYAEPVAEHALSLMLAGMRNVAQYARQSQWSVPKGINLLGAKVSILGGGGITESLLRLLRPFGCHITVVRHNVEHMEGAADVVGPEHLVDALAGADVVVLALALTARTKGLISRSELEVMESHTWIVNVARGGHIVTDDLVWALQEGRIGGAALDVTDPEPLPAGHPLWSQPNCIITPHIGNTPEMAAPLLAARIRENVARFIHGESLIGAVDPKRGY